jgi:hypothetical protein
MAALSANPAALPRRSGSRWYGRCWYGIRCWGRCLLGSVGLRWRWGVHQAIARGGNKVAALMPGQSADRHRTAALTCSGDGFNGSSTPHCGCRVHLRQRFATPRRAIFFAWFLQGMGGPEICVSVSILAPELPATPRDPPNGMGADHWQGPGGSFGLAVLGREPAPIHPALLSADGRTAPALWRSTTVPTPPTTRHRTGGAPSLSGPQGNPALVGSGTQHGWEPEHPCPPCKGAGYGAVRIRIGDSETPVPCMPVPPRFLGA